MFGVIEEHIKKLYETLLVNEKKLKANIDLFKNQYANQDEILEYYLLVSQKKLEELMKRDIIIILEHRSIKVESAKINKFTEAYKNSLKFILDQAQLLKPKHPDNVNIEK